MKMKLMLMMVVGMVAPVFGQVAPEASVTELKMKVANLEREVAALKAENARLKGGAPAMVAPVGPGAPVAAATPAAAPVPAADAGAVRAEIDAIQAEIGREMASQAQWQAELKAREKVWNPPADAFGRGGGIKVSAADQKKVRDAVAQAVAESGQRVQGLRQRLAAAQARLVKGQD